MNREKDTKGMLSSRRILAASGVALAAVLASAFALRARAAGAPSPNALVYTGYLETPQGEPMSDAVTVALKLWDAPSAGGALCELAGTSVTPLAGRFQLQLSDQCTAAVAANPNVFLEATVNGKSLGRSKLAAVPYAIEANHATSTDSASASGALATELAALKADIATLKSGQTTLKARLDAPVSSTLTASKARHEQTTAAFTWVSGTASTKLSAGRYWVFNTMRGYRGTETTETAVAHLSVCVRKAGTLEVLPSQVVLETRDYTSLPTTVIDYVDLAADTNAVELGFCAKQADAASASTVLGDIRTIVLPLSK